MRRALVVRGIRVALPQSLGQLTSLFERCWGDRGLSARPRHLRPPCCAGTTLLSLGRCHLRWQKEASLGSQPRAADTSGVWDREERREEAARQAPKVETHP